MKTEKYFIQQLTNVWLDREGTASKKEWFDWYGDAGGCFYLADFNGFDSLKEADSTLSKITKLEGDKFRIIKRTSVITDEEVYYEAY